MNETELLDKILALTSEYYEKKHGAATKKFEPGKTYIPASGKTFDDNELKQVVKCALEFSITANDYATALEKKLAEVFGTKFCLLTNSGSSANLLAVSALCSPRLGSKALKPGDEVITSACGFPTTVNPIIQNGLVPVFVDAETDYENGTATYNPTYESIVSAVSDKTRAIILAHTLGNPYDAERLSKFAKEKGIWLIEDCCDALGSKLNGKGVGTFGDIATLSMYPAHHMSCSKNTPIPYLNPDGQWTVDTIENIYSKYVNVPRKLRILAFDKSNKVKWSTPSLIIRHKLGKKRMVRITSQHGRMVEVTEDHSVFILDKKTATIIPVYARQIKPDDYLVATNNIPNPEEIVYLDVLDCFVGKNAYVENFSHVNLKEVKNRDYAWQYKSRSSLPIRYLKKFNLEKEKLRIGLLQSSKIPIRIPVTKSLCRLIGYFLSEGSYSNGLVFSFSVAETDLIDDVIRISKSVFGITPGINKQKETGVNVKIASKNIEIVFREKLGIKAGAKNKRIPSFLYHSNENCIKAFIFAYTSGDGSIRKLKDNTNRIDVTSTSKDLLNDFQYLLSRIGISASYYRRNREKRNERILDKKIIHANENYTLSFSGYVYSNKTLKKQNIKNRNSFSDQIPLLPIFRKHISVGKKQQTISKQRLMRYVQGNAKLQELLNGGVCFLGVRHIEVIMHDPDEYVYDFSVPGKENFYGGFLGLFLHNTIGEGGALFTNNPLLKREIASYRDWGRDCWCEAGKDNTCGKRFGWKLGELPFGYDHKYIYSTIGYNLKTTDLNAAIGLAQVEKLPRFVEARKRNFAELHAHLKQYEKYIILPKWIEGAEPSWFGFLISVREGAPFTRAEFVNYLESRKIGTRMLFGGNLLKQPAYLGIKCRKIGQLKNADFVMNNTFWIGVHPGIDKERMEYMKRIIGEFFKGKEG